LPPHLLLVDSMLKKNVCSLGHKTQRIDDVLAAHYAFEEKYWVNIPELIWKRLQKCWEDMIEKRLASASQRPLPFPCLITKLIIDGGIPILERAPVDRNIPIFGLTQWEHSISHIPQLGEPQVEMEIHDAPADEIHEGKPSAPKEVLVPSTPTDFLVLQGQMDQMDLEMREMRATQIEILARQTAMETMMRECFSRFPPPNAAP
jgi:hypothetical protein